MSKLLIVSDSAGAAADISGQLAGLLETRCVHSSQIAETDPDGLIVVDINLADGDAVSTLRGWLGRRPPVGKVIFIVDPGVRRQTVQAFAIGATDVMSRPFDGEALLTKLFGGGEAFAGVSVAVPNADAVMVGVGALQDAFEAACAGAPLDLPSIEVAGDVIVSHIKVEGLAHWIGNVRKHHGQTYQHCLLVTGVAVSFGQTLGFGESDQHRLALAGLLHDIGKARIPIAILEKPGALTDAEMSVMKQHPTLGIEVLRPMRSLPPLLRDIVLHHHEYLDGSGYPDRLRSAEIPDLVRITTIADVFGALIERRAYKPPLSSEAAYEIVRGMGPKLDCDLVREFARVVGQPLS
ncbi:MAG: HD domain-containing phosphohydrolase [Xanthobacteraceae bacterium]